jgi:hypothetical protein
MKKRIFCFCALLLSLSGSGAAWSDDKVVTPQPLVPSFRVDPFWAEDAAEQMAGCRRRPRLKGSRRADTSPIHPVRHQRNGRFVLS